MKRGHLALRSKAVALCTPTSERRLPDLATALGPWGIRGATSALSMLYCSLQVKLSSSSADNLQFVRRILLQRVKSKFNIDRPESQTRWSKQ